MKKWWVLLILLTIFFIPVKAFTCPNYAEPNSSNGWGAVEICNIRYYCGEADSICPEDYQDALTLVTTNCSLCPDPDCTGNLSGYVFDAVTGQPLANANVSLQLSIVPGSVLTNAIGFYRLFPPTGYQLLSAAKAGYDTVVKEAFVTKNNTELNFSLPLGVCHADCTNAFNRCSAACNGYTFTNASGTDACNYAEPEIMDACENKVKDVEVFIDFYNETHSWFANCCEGTRYLKYHASADTECEGNLIKFTKIVRYQEKPVQLVVVVCDN
ncbi:hypothetical protein C4573_01940 [Candidatus Woesearchaeota archaeon]|nr:MAG: hypothetical protein C4573_01940 [Candidatus Woesearchaeota archaeon]